MTTAELIAESVQSLTLVSDGTVLDVDAVDVERAVDDNITTANIDSHVVGHKQSAARHANTQPNTRKASRPKKEKEEQGEKRPQSTLYAKERLAYEATVGELDRKIAALQKQAQEVRDKIKSKDTGREAYELKRKALQDTLKSVKEKQSAIQDQAKQDRELLKQMQEAMKRKSEDARKADEMDRQIQDLERQLAVGRLDNGQAPSLLEEKRMVAEVSKLKKARRAVLGEDAGVDNERTKLDALKAKLDATRPELNQLDTQYKQTMEELRLLDEERKRGQSSMKSLFDERGKLEKSVNALYEEKRTAYALFQKQKEELKAAQEAEWQKKKAQWEAEKAKRAEKQIFYLLQRRRDQLAKQRSQLDDAPEGNQVRLCSRLISHFASTHAPSYEVPVLDDDTDLAEEKENKTENKAPVSATKRELLSSLKPQEVRTVADATPSSIGGRAVPTVVFQKKEETFFSLSGTKFDKKKSNATATPSNSVSKSVDETIKVPFQYVTGLSELQLTVPTTAAAVPALLDQLVAKRQQFLNTYRSSLVRRQEQKVALDARLVKVDAALESGKLDGLDPEDVPAPVEEEEKPRKDEKEKPRKQQQQRSNKKNKNEA